MGPLDALWHLLNFFAPPVGVGLITTVLARLVWWRELRGAGFARLAAWAIVGCTAGWVAALIIFERDGKMAGYALMLTSGSMALWWTGLRGSRI